MVTNATSAALMCLGSSSGFEVRQVPRRKPAAGGIEVTVAAASVHRCAARARLSARDHDRHQSSASNLSPYSVTTCAIRLRRSQLARE